MPLGGKERFKQLSSCVFQWKGHWQIFYHFLWMQVSMFVNAEATRSCKILFFQRKCSDRQDNNIYIVFNRLLQWYIMYRIIEGQGWSWGQQHGSEGPHRGGNTSPTLFKIWCIRDFSHSWAVLNDYMWTTRRKSQNQTNLQKHLWAKEL